MILCELIEQDLEILGFSGNRQKVGIEEWQETFQ